MPASMHSMFTWWVAAAVVLGIVLRPWRLPEYTWAIAGAVALLLAGVLSPGLALGAIGKGKDVYLFLIGMMTLAELARREGLFDWLAALAVNHANGSAQRLFDLVFLVGIGVTVLLSNDATAVVLTPAVYAAARAAKASPLPYLFICAFVANAASFVLPISNPANLVVFGSHMPPLHVWLLQFGLPSVAAIALTYAMLRLTQRKPLRQPLHPAGQREPLPRGARLTAWGIGATSVLLLVVSALNMDLGLPTFLAGVTTAAGVLLLARRSPWALIKGVSWGVLPLVAGLFIIVEGLARSPVINQLAHALAGLAHHSPQQASWAAGLGVALASNLVNNLPAGLIAGSLGQIAALPQHVTSALLIGVDLGPNLSISGSLATLLWLIAIRREGQNVGAWAFLKLGVVVMLPALVAALAALALVSAWM